MKIIYLFIFTFLSVAGHAAETALPVRVASVEIMPVEEEISLTGNIATQRISNLSSRVDALVTEVLVEAGGKVKRGDTLIRLDSALAEYDVKRSAAAVAEADAELKESIRKRDELSQLIEKKFLAQTAYEAAASDVQIKSAALKRLKAAHQRDIELLNQHVIKAPFDGVISKKRVETGQWIKVGNSVLELVDMKNLRVEVSVPQRYFSKLRQGLPVIIYPDALPGKQIKAEITYKIPVANVTARNFPVHIDIENTDNAYTPGMTTHVVFLSSEENNQKPALLAPRDAISKKANEPDTLWVISETGGVIVANPVNVKTGRTFDGNIEILEGAIEAGMQVVIRGNEILKPGQQVKISP